MSISNKKEYSLSLSEEERKFAAWENARPTSDSYRRFDFCGLPIDWDQFGKPSAYGWVIEYIQPLEEGGRDVPANVRARRWCGCLERFEIALLMTL